MALLSAGAGFTWAKAGEAMASARAETPSMWTFLITNSLFFIIRRVSSHPASSNRGFLLGKSGRGYVGEGRYRPAGRAARSGGQGRAVDEDALRHVIAPARTGLHPVR